MTFELQKDSRIHISLTSTVKVSFPVTRADLTLDAIPEEDFLKVKETIDLLGKDISALECKKDIGEFAYSIKVGSKNSNYTGLTDIFTGEGFSKTPIIIEELEKLLQQYTIPEVSTLKP